MFKKLSISLMVLGLSVGGFTSTSYANEPIPEPYVYVDEDGTYEPNDNPQYVPPLCYPNCETEEPPIEYTDGIPRTNSWDRVGGDLISTVKGFNASGTQIFESTGGDIKVQIWGHRSNQGNTLATTQVRLYENDGNTDVYVTTLGYMKPNGADFNFIYQNASAYLDGTNNRAEFKVKLQSVGYTADLPDYEVTFTYFD